MTAQLASPMLEVRGLCGWYGAAQVLFDLDLQLRPGEVLALMGRNGAGKSTTLKALMGLLEKRSGQVSFMGRDIAQAPAHAIARLGIGYVPEDRRIFSELTVLENLEVARQAPRVWASATAAAGWTVERLFDLFPNLRAMPDRLGARMSGGEQQMLSVARTLMGNPCLVLLDEPSEGIAPMLAEQMAGAILGLKAQGVAIVLCEQNLGFAARVADQACVLEQGRLRYSASMAELLADRQARAFWLGL